MEIRVSMKARDKAVRPVALLTINQWGSRGKGKGEQSETKEE